MVMLLEITEKRCVKKRYPYWKQQHCAAISAIAELLFTVSLVLCHTATTCVLIIVIFVLVINVVTHIATC